MMPLDLPPVSSFFATVAIFLYIMGGQLLGIKNEADVYVSWQKVVVEGQMWRIFVSHFFHFGRIHIFVNVVTLMAIGRVLERKIQPLAYAALIGILSIMSNILYILLNDFMCSGPNTDYTVGFTTLLISAAMFSLRMLHILTMESEANNGKRDPSLVFGFLPMYLPTAVAPWLPILETIFVDAVIIGKCVASANSLAGMSAGLIFPYLLKNFRDYIMYPRRPPV